jgi:hypothetical protein
LASPVAAAPGERILAHFTQRAREEQQELPFTARAPPQPSLL